MLLYAAVSLLNDFFCDKAIIDKTLFDATFIFRPSGGQTIYCAKRGTVHLEVGKYAGGTFVSQVDGQPAS